MRSGRGRGRLGHALAVSAVLHAGVVAGFWVNSSRGPAVERLRVYAVDIVSPPPRTAGEPAPERVAPEQRVAPTPEPEIPAAPAPEPERATPPVQPVATPQPATATPREAESPARREPSPPNPTTTQPTPPPAQRPRTTPRETPPAQRTEPTPRTTPTPARDAEVADRTTPSSGASPSPASTGGENLAIRTQGVACPNEEYCSNIMRQVTRYFRRPPQSRTDRADVCFRIARNGSVSDIRIERLSGAYAFGSAISEAVEQAARREEFGPLPRAFNSDVLPVCVAFTPES